ncbi:uncharacterized protein LOC143070914 isoform X2 [Mytilus galloprovincialis]|uniref:uncharacterized protein LOC143070914 isoform X2 n=1 Tax=Mytilus galloprovincialis TaxID=29158 RepID=UPI003F7C9313
MSPNDNTTGKRLPIKDCCAVVEAYKMFVQTWIYRSKNDKGHVPDQVGSSNVTLEAKNKVEKIWAESVNQRYFLAKVYGNVITYEDIGSLNEHSWLTDKVMDAYISHLSQVENDKGTIKVRHELVSTTNNILNGQYVPGRNETIVEPQLQRIIFLNEREWFFQTGENTLGNWKCCIQNMAK